MFSEKKTEKVLEIARAMKGKRQTGRQFHMTFVFHRSRIVCIGINDYTRPHPEHKFGSYHAYKCQSPKYQPGVHSEIDALIKLGETDCSRFVALNVRVGNDGKIRLAKPCKNCEGVLKQVGFKRVYYTDRDGQIAEWKG